MFTAAHAWNGSASIAFRADDAISAVHTSAGDIVVEGRAVSLLQWEPARRRTVFTLPSRTLAAHLVDTNDGPLLVYIRTSSGADDGRDDAGAIMAQRLDANGRANGRPVDLGATNPAFVETSEHQSRAEAGRIIIAAEQPDASWHYGVFGADFRLRSSGEGAGIHCPLAGCVRVVGRTDPFATQAGGDDGQIRAEIVSHAVSIPFAVSGDHVEDVAVRENRMLAVIRSGEPGAYTRSLAVLDVSRRVLVPVSRATSDQPVVSWMIAGLHDAPLIRTTRDGFVAVYRDASEQTQIERIVCER